MSGELKAFCCAGETASLSLFCQQFPAGFTILTRDKHTKICHSTKLSQIQVDDKDIEGHLVQPKEFINEGMRSLEFKWLTVSQSRSRAQVSWLFHAAGLVEYHPRFFRQRVFLVYWNRFFKRNISTKWHFYCMWLKHLKSWWTVRILS